MAIIGLDEVGRGPWAGPLVIGAVILPEKRPAWVEELRDSKKLSEKRRNYLSEFIAHESTATGLGWVWQYEFDEIGMSEALRLAARRALADMRAHFPKASFSEIIIDGTQNLLAGSPYASYVSTLVKGDDLIKEISAASILAKVARDNYMISLAEKYPEYAFEKHKGYGTKKHLAALEQYGVTPEHRLSLRPIRRLLGLPETSDLNPSRRNTVQTTNLPNNNSQSSHSLSNHPLKNTTKIGSEAEQIVAEFLESKGHEILFQNYKTQLCEIDLISYRNQNLYFTEVKYRKNDQHGSGLTAITPVKKRQMEFASQIFLANHPEFQSFNPFLAVADVTSDEQGTFILKDFFPLDE